MYLFFGIFFFILLFFFCINYWRKKQIIKKVCSLSCQEKCKLVNELTEPFGFTYVDSQDIFTSCLDAWQREFGYCSLYDETAYHFHLIYDCLPVYFNYKDKTWLIELWKGQYGINTGAEIGVYHADRILTEQETKNTLFKSVYDSGMLKFSFALYRKGVRIADICAKHWWLTAFSLGRFSQPADLYMRANIIFPDLEMLEAFTQGLINAGICEDDICVCCNAITFSFTKSFTHFGWFRRFRIAIAQCCNKFWCNVYLFITRPFCLSLDKILYLYYYLPFIFRKMLRIRKYKKFKQ